MLHEGVISATFIACKKKTNKLTLSDKGIKPRKILQFTNQQIKIDIDNSSLSNPSNSIIIIRVLEN